MQDNLRLCRKMLTAMQGFLPNERITRLRNLAFLTAGLFLAESAHLSKVARTWPVPGRLVSLTNRLRRFLKNPRVEVGRLYRPLARTLLASFEEPWQEVHLILDTTKVGFGHRVLTVSLGYRKRALPLCWSVHAGRRGHTTAEAQIALLRRVKPLLPPESPVWVMGDSEFGHVELLCWLADQGYHYVLRTSGQSKIVLSEQAQSEQAQSEQAQSGRWIKLSETGLKEGQTRPVGAVRFTEKHDYRQAHLLMHWAEGEDEPWYLLSDRPVGTWTIRRYRKRMWIEQMYADLKGRGVNVEATHLRHADRIERLMLGVCWAYVWLLVLGSYVVKRGWRPRVDRKSRRDKSYFRIGWDFTERCMCLGNPIRLHFTPYFRK